MEKWELKGNSRIFSWEGRSVNKTHKESVDVMQSFSRKPFDTYIPNQSKSKKIVLSGVMGTYKSNFRIFLIFLRQPTKK